MQTHVAPIAWSSKYPPMTVKNDEGCCGNLQHAGSGSDGQKDGCKEMREIRWNVPSVAVTVCV